MNKLNKDFAIGFLCCFCLLSLMALSQINSNYKSDKAVYEEFYNIYQNFQPLKFKVFTTTPSINKLQDNEMVIYSSGNVTPYASLMFRRNQELYAIAGSCITVAR